MPRPVGLAFGGKRKRDRFVEDRHSCQNNEGSLKANREVFYLTMAIWMTSIRG